MFDRQLRLLRAKVARLDYVMTLHAEEEMDDDDLTIFDIESCILTGRIVVRQRDRRTNEWKYGIRGDAVDGREVDVVAKIPAKGPAVILTVYTL